MKTVYKNPDALNLFDLARSLIKGSNADKLEARIKKRSINGSSKISAKDQALIFIAGLVSGATEKKGDNFMPDNIEIIKEG